ncbi:MAG: family 20 glycosylhydrolase [Candidatus Cloacimonetes bacterium]|nr:family 20 glycosylhydrolase [Candidatus Cloacimonadota bacterium]
MIPTPTLRVISENYLQIASTPMFRVAGKNCARIKRIVTQFEYWLHGYLGASTLPPKDGILLIDIDLNVNLNHLDGAYIINVSATEIMITTDGEQGLRNAFASLKQLIHRALTFQQGKLETQFIGDNPAYEWRGLHLDVSRHFFGVKEVCQYLDWMAALKLNRFHWHLSDDQGWRINSTRFPLLTRKGAWRKEDDGSIYGGFYTKKEIKEVVKYARSLGITVIPEIDLPGHAMAILSAYPDLACFPREFEPLTVWGISEDILCAGKDATLSFLKELLLEVAELFPGPYLHIGGDEAPKHRWKECPHCQQRIRQEGLQDEEELQSWLIQQLQQTLEDAGKTLLGWDEILDGNLGTQPIVHVWSGDGKDAARKAAANGNRYIISPNKLLYFDWRAEEDPATPGAHGVTSLEKVMAIKPREYEFGDGELLLGGQANVWTEYMPDFATVKKMLFPRVFAMAELWWNGQCEDDLPQRIKEVESLW